MGPQQPGNPRRSTGHIFFRIMRGSCIRPVFPRMSLRHSKSSLSLKPNCKRFLGQPTQFALWEDPFAPTYLKGLAQNQGHMRQARLLAEEAESHLYHALASGADPTTLNSLLVGARLLDYAGQKFQTPSELIELWGRIGTRRPETDKWWNEWESQVVYQDHSRIVDLMDAITELRPLYREEWLDEYSPYRLASALGRWDAEYEYWRRFQQRLQQFSDGSHEGDVLPPLEKLAEEH